MGCKRSRPMRAEPSEEKKKRKRSLAAFVELARSLLSCVLHVYEPVDALAEGDTSLGGRHGCGALAYALVPTHAASGESGARQERAFWGRRWERRPGGTPTNCHVISMHASVEEER